MRPVRKCGRDAPGSSSLARFKALERVLIKEEADVGFARQGTGGSALRDVRVEGAKRFEGHDVIALIDRVRRQLQGLGKRLGRLLAEDGSSPARSPLMSCAAA